MNVLLTCCGRRDYMVRYFREALAGKGSVFAANSIAEASAMMTADDAFIVPPVRDESYVDTLRDLCRSHAIRLIVPLFDLELPVLARNRARLERDGITVLISSEAVINVCHDKWETYRYLRRNGFQTPSTYRSVKEARSALRRGVVQCPLIVKPRFGMGSIGIVTIEDEQELDALYRYAKRKVEATYLSATLVQTAGDGLLVQEYIEGPQYGLDVVNDLKGDFRACFVKRKVAMRSGETDIGKTEDSRPLRALGRRIGETLQHRGILGADVLVAHGKHYIIDLNNRFTGHYPCSHVAGADVPAAILAWAANREADPTWLRVQEDVVSVKGVAPMQVRHPNATCQPLRPHALFE